MQPNQRVAACGEITTDTMDTIRMDTYLTTAEAATRLNLSEVRVRQLCVAGRLGKKMGRDWLISEEELAEFSEIPRPVGRPPRIETPKPQRGW